jgi:hypothetical protein
MAAGTDPEDGGELDGRVHEVGEGSAAPLGPHANEGRKGMTKDCRPVRAWAFLSRSIGVLSRRESATL